MYSIPTEWKRGVTGSILFHIGVLAILIIFGFTTPLPLPEEQGILVNFGTEETGEGLTEPSGSSVEPVTAEDQSASGVSENATDPILTQDIEKDAPAVKTQEEIEADRKLQLEIEANRIIRQQQETERLRIAEEQRRQSEIMARTRNAIVGAQNSGTSSAGEGITGGPGNQGVVTGSVNSPIRGEGSGQGTSGISYSLEGRGSISLPKPKYDYQEGGIVVVEVTVDRTGKVISAKAGAKGSTTLVDYFLKVSADAAMQARFEAKPSAPEIQKGTITYNFILN